MNKRPGNLPGPLFNGAYHMLIQNLAKNFETRVKLPIEIFEVRDAVVRLGIQDSIIFSGEDMDPANCRGAFYQYTQRAVVYGEPELVSLIVYSQHLTIPWQRMVCCKEIMHVLDKQEGKTNKKEEVVALAEKLLGPLSSEDYGLADFMAATDRLALYQGLAVLFPLAARTQALDKVKKTKTVAEIAEWASVPEPLVNFVLDPAWPKLRDQILDC